MGFGDRLKRAIQIVVGGHSVGRTVVKGATINSGAYRPKQGEEWLHAYNTMPWLRANVSKIAGGVAGLEWGITRTMDENGMTVKRPDLQRGGYEYRQKALAAMEDEETAEATFDHPFLTLLKNPCPALPGKAALILAQVYYEVVGEVFFVVDRGSRDEWLLKEGKMGRPLPTALWPIPPTWVKRVPTPDQPTFEIRQSGLQMNDIPLTEVLWLKNPDPVNPYARGVGLFNSLTDELDSDENAAKMIAYSFYNRNRPDVLVSLPGADEIELRAFRNDWVSSLQGVTNALKNHFVNVEAKVEQLGYDFREMQVIDLRRHTRDTIRQVPGMPPEILGIQDQSNRSTIDAAEYIFAKHVIVPRAEIWRDFWQTQVVIEYDDRAILDYITPVQEDKNFTLNIATGRPEVMKVNEVRKLGGLPALTDEEGGNLFFVNGSFVPTLAPPVAPPMPGAEAGAGAGLSIPGFEGGINVPGAAQMHLSVPGAAGSPESGLPATPGAPQGPPGGNPPPAPGGPAGGPPAPPAPDGNGPGFTLAGRPKPPEDEDDPTDPGATSNRRKGYRQGGAVREAARNFRPRTLAAAEVTPDEAILISKWFAANDYEVNPSAILKTAPIPITDDRATEWLRRAMAYLAGTPTKSWNPMFGPWTQHDTDLVDTILKGDYEGHPFRGNQWTTGEGGEGPETRAESSAPALDLDKVRAKIESRNERISKLQLDMIDVIGRQDAADREITKLMEGKSPSDPAEQTRLDVASKAWFDGPGKNSDLPLASDLDADRRGPYSPEDWAIAKEYHAAAAAATAREEAYYRDQRIAQAKAGWDDLVYERGRIAEEIGKAQAANRHDEAMTSSEVMQTRHAQRTAEAREPRNTPALAQNPTDSKIIDEANANIKHGDQYSPITFWDDGPRLNEANGRGDTLKIEPNFKATIKDAKDFKAKMGKTFPGIEIVGVPRNADLHVLTQVHDEFTALRDEFPEVVVREVRMNAGGYRGVAYLAGDDKITLAKKCVEDFSVATIAFGSGKTRDNPEQEPGFHDGTRNYASVVRHEFGHQLHSQHPELLKEFEKVAVSMPRSVRTKVTGYGRKNSHELFAETFSMLKYGDEATKSHPLVKEMDRLLKDYFKRTRGGK